jgi:hypothetical protein
LVHLTVAVFVSAVTETAGHVTCGWAMATEQPAWKQFTAGTTVFVDIVVSMFMAEAAGATGQTVSAWVVVEKVHEAPVGAVRPCPLQTRTPTLMVPAATSASDNVMMPEVVVAEANGVVMLVTGETDGVLCKTENHVKPLLPTGARGVV